MDVSIFRWLIAVNTLNGAPARRLTWGYKMKYIVTANENGDEEIFIFSKKINHDCMAESLISIKDQSWGNWECIYRYPISAGFTDGKECWGRSETLGNTPTDVGKTTLSSNSRREK